MKSQLDEMVWAHFLGHGASYWLDALCTGDVFNQRLACKALGQIDARAEAYLSAIRRATEDSDEMVRKEAAHALERFENYPPQKKPSVEKVVAELTSQDKVLSCRALHDIAKLGPVPELIQLLLRAVADSSAFEYDDSPGMRVQAALKSVCSFDRFLDHEFAAQHIVPMLVDEVKNPKNPAHTQKIAFEFLIAASVAIGPAAKAAVPTLLHELVNDQYDFTHTSRAVKSVCPELLPHLVESLQCDPPKIHPLLVAEAAKISAEAEDAVKAIMNSLCGDASWQRWAFLKEFCPEDFPPDEEESEVSVAPSEGREQDSEGVTMVDTIAFIGDYGGQIYVVCPVRYIYNCHRPELNLLLFEIDQIAWGDVRGAWFRYGDEPIGGSICGGMGGAPVTHEIWIHDEFKNYGLDSAICDVLLGVRRRLCE